MITRRQLSILNAIVEDYVELGQPIGSNTLIRRHNVDVSPATIRNDMKSLEENDLIKKTHFSSGRVPSEQGFRLYANRLLEASLDSDEQSHLSLHEMFVNHHYDISSTLDNFAKVFSIQTHYTTLVIGPDHSKSTILDVHLMKVNPHHLIVVLVYKTGHVKHLHVSTQQTIDDQSIIKVSNYLSQSIHTFLNDGQNHHFEMYRMLGFDDKEINLITHIYQLIEQCNKDESSHVYLGGKHQLIEGLNESNVASIQPILKYIESEQITEFIHKVSNHPINIRIGTEIENNLHGVAILTSPYQIEKDLNGYIAVIGPTAMRYQNVIQLLSRIS